MDTELLRERLMTSCREACFGTEFPRMFYDSFEIESASEDEILAIAERMGTKLRRDFLQEDTKGSVE